jgi:hypothetical protein
MVTGWLASTASATMLTKPCRQTPIQYKACQYLLRIGGGARDKVFDMVFRYSYRNGGRGI